MKTAIITGSAGQDGTYMTEHLHKLGYHIIGLPRSGAVPACRWPVIAPSYNA